MDQPQEVSRGELKKIRLDEAIGRKRRKFFLRIGGTIVAAGILVFGIVWAVRERNQNLPGISYPSIGQEHIALKDDPKIPYNSNPPSSGAHFSSPANWGIYDYEVNDKIFIHNLEHGGIWIAYKPGVPPQAVEDLKTIINEFDGSKFIMAPRVSNDADVAVVAWTRLLKFDLANAALSDEQKGQIRAFYKSFRNRGPEFVPDTMPGVDPKSVQE